MKRDEILRIAKPILFNTEMVRAILEGRKTVTRRLIKDKDTTNRFDIDVDGKAISYIEPTTGDFYPPYYPCRYKPGDYLYVRETFCIIGTNGTCHKYGYKADGLNYGTLYHPSIHMPKEAARIFLRVTNVMVDRLNAISIDEIAREGVQSDYMLPAFHELWDSTIKPADRDKYGWNANPWVWVIEFERVAVENV